MKALKLLIFLPVFLCSFEIEFSKKFSKDLTHDILTAYISVTIEDDTEMEVSQRLEVFNEKIKNYDKVEKKLGTFNIQPKYKHSKNTPNITGYIGELRYKIHSYNAKNMDDFISKITKLKKNRDTTVSVNDLSWTVREDTFNVTLDLLRLEAINWASDYVKILSKDISKSCSIKKIKLTNMRQVMYQRNNLAYTSRTMGSKSIPVPQANQEEIRINPEYVVECQ